MTALLTVFFLKQRLCSFFVQLLLWAVNDWRGENHSAPLMNRWNMWTLTDSFWKTTRRAVSLEVKWRSERERSLLFVIVTLNADFTSPPSCQRERALVRFRQLHCWTGPSLAGEELSKTIKVSRKNCVSSQVLSPGWGVSNILVFLVNLWDCV